MPQSFLDDQTTILVVDDNLDEVAELCDAIDGMGHNVKGVESVRSALHVLEQDRTVKIVITDIRMEGMDGFDLLAEIDARYGHYRPIAKIVASGYQEYDYAIEAMRLGAIDIIQKPCSANAIKAAIRRALILQHQRRGRPAPMSAPAFEEADADGTAIEGNEKLQLIKGIQKQRQIRSDLIECDSFSDPAWDIFLDLCSARFSNQKVSISSACAATDAPFSTALRYVNRLVAAGLAIRYDDPLDKRRNMLELSEDGQAKIETFLAEIAKTTDGR
ncbi:response regulator [Novosphingobium sp. MW5]|nr:response regulator [Novosphingobium sp. MW5]